MKFENDGGVLKRPVVGRVNTECAALVKRLVSQAIDMSRLLEFLLNGGRDVRVQTFGAKIYLGLNFRLRFA